MRDVWRISLVMGAWACATPSVSGPRADDIVDVDEGPPEAQVILGDTPHVEPLTARVRLDEPDRPGLTITWSWTRDGEPLGVVGPDVPAPLTSPGEVWEATATVSDGVSSTTATGRAVVTNAAPEVLGARITPAPIRATSTLALAYDEVVDAEGDPAVVHWSWWVDGEERAVDGSLRLSELAGGEEVRLRVTASDGYDETTLELGPVIVPQRRVAVDLVVVVDVTGSTHAEYPELGLALRDLALRVGEIGGFDDRLGLVTFAWKYGYEHTPLTPVRFGWRFADWGELAHASRIRGADPDPDDDGLRPHMPREYDGEQGSDPHVGLMMARTMLTERPHDDRELAILLVTDGQPLPVRRSDVRDRIGYVEDRWRFEEGVAPHSPGAIADATIATAEDAWDDARISTFVVSVRDDEPYLRQTVQGWGTWQRAPTGPQVSRALALVVNGLPWDGE